MAKVAQEKDVVGEGGFSFKGIGLCANRSEDEIRGVEVEGG